MVVVLVVGRSPAVIEVSIAVEFVVIVVLAFVEPVEFRTEAGRRRCHWFARSCWVVPAAESFAAAVQRRSDSHYCCCSVSTLCWHRSLLLRSALVVLESARPFGLSSGFDSMLHKWAADIVVAANCYRR